MVPITPQTTQLFLKFAYAFLPCGNIGFRLGALFCFFSGTFFCLSGTSLCLSSASFCLSACDRNSDIVFYQVAISIITGDIFSVPPEP
jgi:hypothetical protein